MELVTGDYSFLNARLARHYGIRDVYGDHFRRVTFTDGKRGGLLGQSSILTVTSYPNRTSVTMRGRWLLANVLGAPPPPPPPDIPALDEGRADDHDGGAFREAEDRARAERQRDRGDEEDAADDVRENVEHVSDRSDALHPALELLHPLRDREKTKGDGDRSEDGDGDDSDDDESTGERKRAPAEKPHGAHDAADFGPIVDRCGAAAFIPKAELSGAALRAVLR